MSIVLTEKCAVCNAGARYVCSKCFSIGRDKWYCSVEHQRQDWKNHKKSCIPFVIREFENEEKYLVSSTDIKKGEIILKEAPLVIAPEMITYPLCLSCYLPIYAMNRCKICRWPMCNKSTCKKDPIHAGECKYTKKNGIVREISTLDAPHPYYEYVAPLRCLYTKETAPEKYGIICKMKSRKEARTERGRVQQAKDMKKYFKLENFTVEEVMHCCGVAEVNHYKIVNSNRIGIYHIASYFTHSCIPNVFYTFNTKEEVVIKASVDIPKGNILHVSHAYLYVGNKLRSSHLSTQRYFTCTCVRCQDPTELGTFMSCVLCEKCDGGYLYPPQVDQINWKCNKCDNIEDAEKIDNLIDELQTEIPTVKTLDTCEEFLRKTKKLLAENHYVRISAKVSLCSSLKVDPSPYSESSPDDDQITTKYKTTKELLDVSEIVDMGGYSSFKAIILNVRQKALLWVYENLKSPENAQKCLKEMNNIYPTVLAIMLEDSFTRCDRELYMGTKLIEQLVKARLIE